MITLIKIIFYCLYIFTVLGLVFHTSGHPEILHKYTAKYVVLLVLLIIFFIPSIKFLDYLLKPSVITIKKKKYNISAAKKIIIVLLLIILFVFLPAELLIRSMNINFNASPNILTIKNFHPFLQHKLDSSNNISEKELHINQFGFRSEEISKIKPKNTFRIFVLGGSTVLNRNVSYEENFVRLLEKDLNNKYNNKHIEVINAGNDEYTSEHSLIDLMFRIKDFSPDMIIVMQGINDMTASCSPAGFSLGSYKSDYSQYLGSIGPMVFSYFQTKHLVVVNSALITALDRFIQHNVYSDIFNYITARKQEVLQTKPIDNFSFPSINAYKRNTSYFVDFAKTNHVSLILVNQPYKYKTSAKNIIWYAQRQCETNQVHPSTRALITGITLFNNATQKIAKENDIPFINLESQIPKTPDYFRDDVHLTQKGNLKISDILFNYFIENNLIP
jgi:lysophospholipase L1-like esterase